MRRIQHDPGYRQQLAGCAAESFVKYWSEGVIMPQYLDVVRKAAAAKGRKDLVEKLDMAGVA
jgi:hypothetical protein